MYNKSLILFSFVFSSLSLSAGTLSIVGNTGGSGGGGSSGVSTSNNNTWTGIQTLNSSTTFNGTVAITSGTTLGGSAGTNGQVLTSGGTGTVPTWTTILSGTSLLSSTNTWTGGNTNVSSTTFDGTVVLSSGVIASGSAGTNGQFLTSGGNGTIPTWTTFSGTPVYTVITSSTIGAAGSISFTNINQTYDDLIVELYARSNDSSNDEVSLTFNGDTTDADYAIDKRYLGAHVAAANRNIGLAATLSTASSVWRAHTTIYIPQYTGTTYAKICIVRGDAAVDPAGGTTLANLSATFAWDVGNQAITSITMTPISGNFAAGSNARLIGVTLH